MTNKIRILITLLLGLISCNTRNEKTNLIAFNPNSIYCDSNGMPLDSTIFYIPYHLFYDTIPCVYDKNLGIIRLNGLKDKNELSEYFNIDLQTVKDTSEIVIDTNRLKFWSYELYKMQEPLLYDHYLGKDIYRLISFRSFDKPLLVRIEEQKNSVILTVKRLNKNVMYPFIVFGVLDSLPYITPDLGYYDSIKSQWIITNKQKYKEQFSKYKKTNDSIAKTFNIIDYHLVENYSKQVSRNVWDSIKYLIDSTRFWEAKQDLAMREEFIDGSRWIFEGHCKYGYQIKIINNPFLKRNKDAEISKKTKYYSEIFTRIFDLAGLKNERLY